MKDIAWWDTVFSHACPSDRGVREELAARAKRVQQGQKLDDEHAAILRTATTVMLQGFRGTGARAVAQSTVEGLLGTIRT